MEELLLHPTYLIRGTRFWRRCPASTIRPWRGLCCEVVYSFSVFKRFINRPSAQRVESCLCIWVSHCLHRECYDMLAILKLHVLLFAWVSDVFLRPVLAFTPARVWGRHNQHLQVPKPTIWTVFALCFRGSVFRVHESLSHLPL